MSYQDGAFWVGLILIAAAVFENGYWTRRAQALAERLRARLRDDPTPGR